MIKFALFFTFLTLAMLSARGFVVRPDSLGTAKMAASRVTVLPMSSEDSFVSPTDTQERIKTLVDDYPVLLFMKGSKLFPQCGFSNTAVQILTSFGIDFHTVGECWKRHVLVQLG